MSEIMEVVEPKREIITQQSGKIEELLINGNLEKLDEKERVEYYGKVCNSLGLNPLTKPFDYIKLNGKLTLYATKNATEQLRKIYKVSVIDMTTSQVGDVLITKCTVQDGLGRVDVGTGAVTIGNLRGDALANAIMKSETKSKRRATLSICGLGMLDETELETIKQGVIEVPKSISSNSVQKIEQTRNNNDEFRGILQKSGIDTSEFIEFSKFADIKGRADVEFLLQNREVLQEKINNFKSKDK